MFNAGSSFLIGGGSSYTNVFSSQPDTSPPMNTSMDLSGEKPAVAQKAQRPKQYLLPVTLKMLRNLDDEDGGKEVKIHGKTVHQVITVCQVITAERKNASYEFLVTDTTAECKVLYYYDASDSELIEMLDDMKAMDYVRVVGHVRTPDAHISALHMDKVKNHDEVPFHLIEAVTIAMRLTHPEKASGVKRVNDNVRTPDPVSRPKLEMSSTNAVKMPSIKIEAPSLSLEDKIKKWLEDNTKEQGHTYDEVANACGPLEEVTSILESLLDMGDIQTTIDDNHVAMLL